MANSFTLTNSNWSTSRLAPGIFLRRFEMTTNNRRLLAAVTRRYLGELQDFAAQLDSSAAEEQLRTRARVLVELTKTWEALVEVSVGEERPVVQ
jgi:hypothetical protein